MFIPSYILRKAVWMLNKERMPDLGFTPNHGKPGPANYGIQARIPLKMLIRSEMPSDLYNPPW